MSNLINTIKKEAKMLPYYVKEGTKQYLESPKYFINNIKNREDVSGSLFALSTITFGEPLLVSILANQVATHNAIGIEGAILGGVDLAFRSGQILIYAKNSKTSSKEYIK